MLSLIVGGLSAVVTRFLFGTETSWYLPYILSAATLLLSSGSFWSDLLRAGFILATGLIPFVQPRLVRELVLVGGACLAVAGGVTVDSVKAPFSHHFVKLGLLSFPLSVLWLWLFTVLFRFTSRIKGLTGFSGFISGVAFALIILMTQGPFGSWALFASLTAAIVSLSVLRLPTEAGGASALGALLAQATVAGALKNTALLIFIAPALIVGVPLLEVTYRLQSRFLILSRSRRSILDLLSQEGVSDRHALAILTFLQTYLCALALLLVYLIEIHFIVKIVVIGAWFAAGLGLFWLLVRLSPRRSSHAFTEFLGIPLSTLSQSQVLNVVAKFVEERGFHQVITSDTSSVIRALSDPEFSQIVKKADLVTPDGIGVVLGARLLGIPVYERVTGVDLVLTLCQEGASRGWRFFFLGGKPGVADRAAANLAVCCPGLNVVGTHHGYFSPEEEEKVIQEIERSRPDILFVAMGIPKQEIWIARHSHRLKVPVCIGVGGSLDVYAGVTKRAPLWVQKLGLEWLYRVVREPHRLPRVVAIPKFLLIVLGRLIRRRRAMADGSLGGSL